MIGLGIGGMSIVGTSPINKIQKVLGYGNMTFFKDYSIGNSLNADMARGSPTATFK